MSPRIFTRPARAAALFALLAVAGSTGLALAQPADAPTPAKAPDKVPQDVAIEMPAPTKAQPVDTRADTEVPDGGKVTATFQTSPHLEPMRYRHLWIAYTAIWLLIFLFIFRTWKNSEKTSADLEVLKRQLADLEARKDGN